MYNGLNFHTSSRENLEFIFNKKKKAFPIRHSAKPTNFFERKKFFDWNFNFLFGFKRFPIGIDKHIHGFGVLSYAPMQEGMAFDKFKKFSYLVYLATLVWSRYVAQLWIHSLRLIHHTFFHLKELQSPTRIYKITRPYVMRPP